MKKAVKRKIESYLQKSEIGILGTLDEMTRAVRQRIMYYSIDRDFNFYLMSTKGSPKLQQMFSESNPSFMVFGLEEPYDQSWEIEATGTAELLKERESIYFALNRLRERNPFAAVALESGITGQFDFIRLSTHMIRFSEYGETLQGKPPEILKFTRSS